MTESQNIVLKIFKVLIITGQLLLLLFYDFICIIGCVNHSSIDFRYWAILSFAFGITAFFLSHYKPNVVGHFDKLAKIIVLVSLIIGLNFILFDYFNIMVEYDVWLERGMPPSPFCPDF